MTLAISWMTLLFLSKIPFCWGLRSQKLMLITHFIIKGIAFWFFNLFAIIASYFNDRTNGLKFFILMFNAYGLELIKSFLFFSQKQNPSISREIINNYKDIFFFTNTNSLYRTHHIHLKKFKRPSIIHNTFFLSELKCVLFIINFGNIDEVSLLRHSTLRSSI